MLQLTAAGKRYGPRLLFENANWLVTPGEKTALVGANGTGKSTLLKVMADLESLDYGTLDGARNTSIGYLPQDGLVIVAASTCLRGVPVGLSRTALAMEARDGRRSATKLAQLRRRKQPGVRRQSADALLSSGSATRCSSTITATHLDCAGRRGAGWAWFQQGTTGRGRRRSSPAAGRCASRLPNCCLQKPSLLLLDEPTNHLDLESRATGSRSICAPIRTRFILISHDRYFLDVTVNQDRSRSGTSAMHGSTPAITRSI